eukprot:14318129-Alexandrium_andersonii.AAC.1
MACQMWVSSGCDAAAWSDPAPSPLPVPPPEARTPRTGLGEGWFTQPPRPSPSADRWPSPRCGGPPPASLIHADGPLGGWPSRGRRPRWPLRLGRPPPRGT